MRAVGVATANLYPQITLNAGYGFQAVSTDILFNGESVVWNVGAGLLQPIFRVEHSLPKGVAPLPRMIRRRRNTVRQY